MRHMSKILEAYYAAKPFTNAEAIAMRDHTKAAADLLVTMGATFKLAFKEANSVHIRVHEMCVARGLGVE
jgi:hypothetical protein